MAVKRRMSTIDQLLSLKSVGDPRISSDGKQVAYTIQKTDWTEDRFVSQIWIANLETRKQFQLTQTSKGAGGQRT